MGRKEKFSTSNAIFAETGGSKAAAWLYAPEVQAALAMAEENGGEARVIGGAVRDTLLGLPAPAGGHEIDIASTLPPEEILRAARARGYKAVPYAVDYGTVLVIINGRPMQITTLREDIAADGRRAAVRFCRDWAKDAARRDFTVNALSVDRRGRLYDYSAGLEDIAARRLRFIGAPEARIKEDYLRILRYFRFYALMGQGAPDRAALKAIAALKDGARRLSPERVWGELQKLLAAPDPGQSLLWMRAAGVLALILPESEKWGIDALRGLLQNESDGRKADAVLRLMAMIPPRAEAAQSAAARLRLSAKQRRRLENWARQRPVKADLSAPALQKRLYEAQNGKTGTTAERGARQALSDALRLSAAQARIYGREEECRAFQALNARLAALPAPVLPLGGADIAAKGVSGAAIGKALKRLEQDWIESGFTLDKQQLLARL